MSTTGLDFPSLDEAAHFKREFPGIEPVRSLIGVGAGEGGGGDGSQ